MSESMIERVARALFLDRWPDREWTPAEKLDYQGHARAAIEAMLEPTGRMLAEMEPWTKVSGHQEMVWKAGIKAALIWPAGSADRAGVPVAKE